MNDVFEEIVRMLTEVVGEDFLLGIEITPDTRFLDDLGLESIEFVALAGKLQERYGQRVNLAAFVGEMDIDEVIGLTVGRLADYVEAAQSGDAELADIS